MSFLGCAYTEDGLGLDCFRERESVMGKQGFEVGDMVRARFARATVGRVIKVQENGNPTVEVIYGEGAGTRVLVDGSHWANLGKPKY